MEDFPETVPAHSTRAAADQAAKKTRKGEPKAPPAEPEPEPWWRTVLEAASNKELERALEHGVALMCPAMGRVTWTTRTIVTRLRGLDSRFDMLDRFQEAVRETARSYRHKVSDEAVEDLTDFLAGDEGRAMREDRSRVRLAKRLTSWLQTQTPPAAETYHADATVRFQFAKLKDDDFPGIFFHVILTGRKGDRAVRTGNSLRRLATEVDQGQRRFADADDERFLTWLAKSELRHERASYDLERSRARDMGAALHVLDLTEWLGLWGGTRYAEISAGAPLVLARGTARLVISSVGQGPPTWCVEWPTGSDDDMDDATAIRPVPLHEAAVCRDRVSEKGYGHAGGDRFYAIRAGQAWRLDLSGMPADLVALLYNNPELPVDKLRNAGVQSARVLTRFTPRSPGSDAGFIDQVPVTPRVTAWHDPLEGTVTVSAEAESSDARVFVRQPGGQWAERQGPPAPPRAIAPEETQPEPASKGVNLRAVAELDVPGAAGEPAVAPAMPSAGAGEAREPSPHAMIVVPRVEDVEKLDLWLARLVPSSAQPNRRFDSPGVSWRIDRKALVKLVETWDRRPPKVVYRGNSEFRDLVALARPPKLWIEIQSTGIDWFSVSVEMEKAVEALSLTDVIDALAAQPTGELVMLKGRRAYRREDLEEYRRIGTLLADLGLDPESAEGAPQRVHAVQAARAARETLRDLDEEGGAWAELAAAGLRAATSFDGIAPAPVSPETEAFLRPYQRSGADFLVWACQNFGGALLADDMGLGKTIQVLAALTALRAIAAAESPTDGDVTGPAPKKATKSAKASATIVDVETTPESEATATPMKAKRVRKSAKAVAAPAVETGLDDDSAPFEAPPRAAGIPPALVICPASVARNWAREATKFAPGLRVAVVEAGTARREVLAALHDYDLVVTNYALARRDLVELSKTDWLLVVVDEAQAIKNSESDIAKSVKKLPARNRIALTGTPVENRLSDLVSIMEFAVPGYLGRASAWRDSISTGPEAQSYRLQTLRARLRPVLLRRLKSEVAPELPPRVEERIDCDMPEPQREAYMAQLKLVRAMLAGDDTAEVTGQARIQILSALTKLRQLCCDPALVGLDNRGSGKTDELIELLSTLLAEGHKVLVFSQFVKMLERLRTALTPLDVPIRMLHGQTNDRQTLVDEFEADPRPGIFLISLKAGGTGLNLVSAAHVVLFDPWWNPAAEAQAIDRAHRIGQTKTVFAFRLVSKGTIEERILELQEKKRELVKGVLEEESFNRSLTRQDLEYLLRAD